MKNLGANLRAERLARGITLEQIAADTRISMSMLRAIEDGDTEQLPAPVLVKGFLRAYAKKIGLDSEGVIVQYQDAIEEVDARQEAMEKFHQRLRPKSTRKKGLVFLLGLAFLAGLTFLLWQSKHVQQRSPSPTITEQVASKEASQEAAKSGSIAKRSQDQTGQGDQQAPVSPKTGTGLETARLESKTEPSPSTPAGEEVSAIRETTVYPAADYQHQGTTLSPAQPPYVLRVETVETTWLHITVDESSEREYLLKPGEQMTWQATSGYELLIGNAAGLQLYLNGKPLRPLGESGRVVRLRLPDPSLIPTTNSEQTESVNRP